MSLCKEALSHGKLASAGELPYSTTPSRRLSVRQDTRNGVKALNAEGLPSVLVTAKNPRFMHKFRDLGFFQV